MSKSTLADFISIIKIFPNTTPVQSRPTEILITVSILLKIN